MTAPEKKEKLHKILDLILDINTYNGVGNDNSPKAFFEFAGHCNMLIVEVFAEGWSAGKKPTLKSEICIDSDRADEPNKLIEKLQAIKEILDEIDDRLQRIKELSQEDTAECAQCGQEGVKEDMLETVGGPVCEECMEEV